MKKRVLSICLSVVVAMTMCFTTGTAFAGTKSGNVMKEVKPAGNAVEIMGASRDEAPDLAELKSAPVEAEAAVPMVPLNQVRTLPGTVRAFRVSVPAEGCLTLSLAGFDPGDSYAWGVYAKTTGFSDRVYYSSSRNIRRMGVKRGVYTFYVSTYADNLYVRAHFTKIKQSKYGKKKKKAVKIKKNKWQRGVLVTGAQKAHWYKFKNTKKHKVKISFRTFMSQTGNYSGGIRITFYDKRGKFGSRTYYEGEYNNMLELYTIPGNKLRKGTYYIKVESINGGTGHFTLKWK